MPEPIYTKDCLLTMGVFDVFHRGHQRLLTRAKELAEAENLDLLIMTFSPHPTRVLLGDEKCKKLVYPIEKRLELLQEFEPKKIIIENFTREFADKSPDEFIEYLKEILPNLKHITIGFNFDFAKNASGNVKWLEDNVERYGLGLRAVRGLKCDGDIVSSTRIRKALGEGDVQAFYRLATRYYSVSGRVQRGNQLGRTLGLPTLNLPFENEFVPRLGVYVSRVVELESGEVSFGVSNLGFKPTIEESEKKLTLETHILGATKLGYSSDIKVELVDFIRPEKKFDTLDELCNAINVDKEQALEYWQNFNIKE